MLVAGDEFGRTQGGNNNAYCQDNEISWIDWEIGPDGRKLEEFVRWLIRLRREHIVFHRYRFFKGPRTPESEIKDITWLRPDGRERGPEDWDDPEDRCLAYVLSGEAHGYHLTASGEPEGDETFLAILNAHPEHVSFTLPGERFGKSWARLLDTASGEPLQPQIHQAGETFRVEGGSLALLMHWDHSSLAPELERW